MSLAAYPESKAIALGAAHVTPTPGEALRGKWIISRHVALACGSQVECLDLFRRLGELMMTAPHPLRNRFGVGSIVST